MQTPGNRIPFGRALPASQASRAAGVAAGRRFAARAALRIGLRFVPYVGLALTAVEILEWYLRQQANPAGAQWTFSNFTSQGKCTQPGGPTHQWGSNIWTNTYAVQANSCSAGQAFVNPQPVGSTPPSQYRSLLLLEHKPAIDRYTIREAFKRDAVLLPLSPGVYTPGIITVPAATPHLDPFTAPRPRPRQVPSTDPYPRPRTAPAVRPSVRPGEAPHPPRPQPEPRPGDNISIQYRPNVNPTGRTQIRVRTNTRPSPPKPPVREKKMGMSSPQYRAMRALVDMGMEGMELVNLFYDATGHADDLRAAHQNDLSFPDKLKWLFVEGGITQVDAEALLDGVIENYIEDKFYGFMGSLGAHASRELGLSFGLETGPAL